MVPGEPLGATAAARASHACAAGPAWRWLAGCMRLLCALDSWCAVCSCAVTAGHAKVGLHVPHRAAGQHRLLPAALGPGAPAGVLASRPRPASRPRLASPQARPQAVSLGAEAPPVQLHERSAVSMCTLGCIGACMARAKGLKAQACAWVSIAACWHAMECFKSLLALHLPACSGSRFILPCAAQALLAQACCFCSSLWH